jgi:hypothetical protein
MRKTVHFTGLTDKHPLLDAFEIPYGAYVVNGHVCEDTLSYCLDHAQRQLGVYTQGLTVDMEDIQEIWAEVETVLDTRDVVSVARAIAAKASPETTMDGWDSVCRMVNGGNRTLAYSYLVLTFRGGEMWSAMSLESVIHAVGSYMKADRMNAAQASALIGRAIQANLSESEPEPESRGREK